MVKKYVYIHAFFYKQRFFFQLSLCCLTFSWIELQMLLTCCLIHISIIPRHFLYLLYLCPCQELGVFMSYLGDLFFIFIFIFIMINRKISWIQRNLFSCLFFRICLIILGWWRGWNMRIIFKYQKFNLRVLRSLCLIFANFNLALLINKSVYLDTHCVNQGIPFILFGCSKAVIQSILRILKYLKETIAV